MKLSLSIEGMNCSMCVQHVQRTLLSCPGVLGCTVELEPPAAVLDCSADVSLEAISHALEEEGYSCTVSSQG